MIIEIDNKKLADVALYAYKLNKIKIHQCRPFSVRMSYEDIYDKFNSLIDYPTDKLLACINKNSEIKGVLGIITEPDENYMQAQGGVYAKEDYLEVGNEFMRYLKRNFKGNKMVFGYPKENIEGQELMKAHGFNLEEEAKVMSLYKNKLIEQDLNLNNIISLSEEWHQLYRNFSKQFEVGRFWTADKIIENLFKWQVYLLVKENEIIGSIIMQIYNEGNAEIFGIDLIDEFNNIENIKNLLSFSCKKGFDDKIKQVIMFVYNELEYEAVKKVGFIEEDTHLSYSKIL